MIRILLFLALTTNVFAATLTEQVAAMQPGTWATLATKNTVASIDPGRDPALNLNYPGSEPWRGGSGFNALFTAWNSGGFASGIGPCGSMVFVGAGHGDYYGNAVVSLDLCDPAAPTWKRLIDPFTGPIVFPTPNGAWPNGTPDMPHTYDSVVVFGEKLVLGSSQETNLPRSAPFAWVADLAAKRWDGPYPHSGTYMGSSAWDSRRNLAWFNPPAGNATSQFMSFSPVTRTIRNYGTISTTPYTNGSGAMMSYDPDRDVLVVQNFGYSPYNIAEKSLPDPTNSSAVPGPWIAIPQINRPASMRAQGAWQWSPQRKAFVAWMSGFSDGKVYEVKRSDAGYTWTLITDSASTLIPGPDAAAKNGSFDKAQLVTIDGHEVLIVMLASNTGPYMFRLPDVIPPPPPPPPPTCVPQSAIPSELWGLPLCSAAIDICDQPGVFWCDKFDAARDSTRFPGFEGNAPKIANDVLEFTIPSGSNDNAGGAYRPSALMKISNGKTLSFAYDIWQDAGALNTTFTGRKDWVLWSGQSSCTGFQLALTRRMPSFVLTPYGACGGQASELQIPNSGGDYLLQYPDMRCLYHSLTNLDGCIYSRPGVWKRIYVQVDVGTVGQPNSHVLMAQLEDGKWKRFMERSDWRFSSKDLSAGLEHLEFSVYMTNKIPAEHPLGTVRMDNIIMSTQPMDMEMLAAASIN